MQRTRRRPGFLNRTSEARGPGSRLRRVVWGLGVLAAASGCQKAPPDAVLAMRGFSLTLPQVQAEYERVNGSGSFDTTTVATRAKFVRTLADREILLRQARAVSPELTGRRARLYRVLYEKYLYREFLRFRRERFHLSPEVEAENLPRLAREARVRQITILDEARALEAQAALRSGVGFEELARRFGDAPLSPGPAPAGARGRKWQERTVRVDNRRIPPRLIVDALLRDAGPGEVVGPTTTTEGYLISQIESYRPLPEAADTAWVARSRNALEMLAYMNVHETWLDSLKRATGFGFHPESYPIVMRHFEAFWDSVSVLRRTGQTFDFQGVRAPIWRFSSEERAAPLYELNGTRTVEDFVRGLDGVDLDYWPTGGTLEKTRRQVEARLTRLLIETEAEQTGFAASPEFQAVLAPLREKYLLEEFYEVVTADVPPPGDEAIAAEHRRLGDTLRTPELLSFSALNYPEEKEARARAVLDRLRQGPPLLWLDLAPAEAASDTSVKYLPATEMLRVDAPPPEPSWTAYFRAARQMQAGEISELIPATTGGLAIVRVADRRPARAMSLEEAAPLLRERLTQAARDGKIEELLRKERKRLGVRVFSDRLAGR